MIIRQAIEQDIPEMMPHAKAFFDASGIGQFMSYDYTSTAITMRNMIAGDGAVILIAEKDNAIIGGIGAVLALSPWNSREIVCQEMFLFIAPEHRGGTTVLRLIRQLQDWAKQHEADLIVMAAMKQLNFDAVQAVYQRMSLTNIEAHFIGRIN